MTDKEKILEMIGESGWSPPITYDLKNDCYRLVTQRDYDELAKLQRLYREMLCVLKQGHASYGWPWKSEFDKSEQN